MKKENNYLRIVINFSTIIGTILLCIFFYYALKAQIFTSEESLRMFLDRFGIFAPLLFIIIQTGDLF